MNAARLERNLCAVKSVHCSCGYTASGETADELLADVEAHIAAAHTRHTVELSRPEGGWSETRPAELAAGVVRKTIGEI